MHQELPTDEKIKYPITRRKMNTLNLCHMIYILIISAAKYAVKSAAFCDDVAQKPVLGILQEDEVKRKWLPTTEVNRRSELEQGDVVVVGLVVVILVEKDLFHLVGQGEEVLGHQTTIHTPVPGDHRAVDRRTVSAVVTVGLYTNDGIDTSMMALTCLWWYWHVYDGIYRSMNHYIYIYI